MNGRTAEEKFFTLLRAGLRETRISGLSVTDEEWEEILRIARRQTVLGIVSHGISLLPEEEMPPVPQRIALLVETGKISNRTDLVRETARKLVADFQAAGLHPVVMKGPAVGRYYPVPSLRTSGDIDLFFGGKEYSSALSRLAALGTDVRHEPDGSHVYSWDGVTVEHHPRYFDLHLKNGSLPPVPSPEAELLMLSAHILKHAIGVGVGLRQICDTAQACVALQGKYDSEVLLSCIRKAGMQRWHDILCSFLKEYLGVPSDALPAHRPADPSALLGIVRSGGNFGQHRAGGRAGKAGTVGSFLRRLPFSLRTAPRETFRTILELAKGNLTP